MKANTVRGLVFVCLTFSLIGCLPVAPEGSTPPGSLSGTLASPTRLPSPTDIPSPTEPPTATDAPTKEPAATPAPAVGLEIGKIALDFALQDLDGNEIRLADFRGQVVLLNFWAVWCGFCRIEFPDMQAAYETHKDGGFTVLAVDFQENVRTVREFVEEMEVTFPILLDQQGKVTALYRVPGLPTSFLIDQDGVIIDIRLGPVNEEWIETHLAEAGVK